MCGIFAYTGARPAVPILIEGLRRLEYRGYDSAGIALPNGRNLVCLRAAGKIEALERRVGEGLPPSRAGIAHTRWATHGPPVEGNAHPHLDCKGRIAIAHNGIVENYEVLKTQLESRGHVFRSETDSEVLAHLIEEHYEGNIVEAVQKALKKIAGSYGLAVLCADCPDTIVGARLGSPLVVGVGSGEAYLSSDPAALAGFADKAIVLRDGTLASFLPGNIKTVNLDNRRVSVDLAPVATEIRQIAKGDHPHYMLKEIREQGETLRNALRGRVDPAQGIAVLGGLLPVRKELQRARRLVLTGCGTSYYASLVGEYLIEEIASVPVEVEYASELRYRNPILEEGTVVFAVSQSGETADTLAALREAKRKGAAVLGICNVAGSSIARETDAGVFLRAGPEIGVASTKAFTSQVAVFALLALHLGRMRLLSERRGAQIAEALLSLPELAERALASEPAVREIAARHADRKNFLYLGRGLNYPVALEGALKLKEISYIHAEGYPAAEMKHGPIALIEPGLPTVILATRDPLYAKVLSNLEEVKARGGEVIAVGTEGDEELRRKADHVILVPKAPDLLTPILTAIPLQLLAYHIAVLKGRPVDQPRNLAKSVTVE